MTHSALVHKRIRTLLFATFALFGVIIGQLFSVQVVRAGTISDRAAVELLKTSTLIQILDMDMVSIQDNEILVIVNMMGSNYHGQHMVIIVVSSTFVICW